MKNKNLFTVALLLSGIIMFSSCKEETTGFQTQPHNDNALMTMMHEMITEMNAMTHTNDPDYDFAMMMKMHHQGALDMAEYEIANGDDAEIKAMAQEMKTAQQAEIADLDSFISADSAHASVQAFTDKMMVSMNKMEQAKDLQVITGDADYDFASLIIPHHQSAIEMAQAVIEHGHHPEIKDMAMMMIEMQQEEIKKLQAWLLTKKEYKR